MVVENLALHNNVRNGAQGTVKHIQYTLNKSGQRIAECMYIHIIDFAVNTVANKLDIVPITLVKTLFTFIDENTGSYNIV